MTERRPYFPPSPRPVERAGIVAASLVVALGACRPDDGAATAEAGAAEPGPRPHVVVVLVDTLRVDHTTVGGYARDTTPGLVRLAAAGTTFENHFVNAPWTKPSVASILTGLLPPSHGAQWGTFAQAKEGAAVDVLPEAFETLPERLRAAGYATHGFMTNTTLSENLGFAQGFDRYELLSPDLAGDERAIERTKAALDGASGPTFVWCHLLAPHNYELRSKQRTFRTPGRTPIRSDQPNGPNIIAKYRIKTRERAIDVYDQTVVWTDERITELWSHLRERHPNTLLVVTSDHGEEFMEHRGWLHARTLYNEILRVPLVLWGPGVPAGRRVTRITSATDVFPTVLDLVGLPVPDGLQGTSLVGPSGGSGAAYAEKRYGRAAKRAWIDADGKWIETKPRIDGRGKPPVEGEGRWEYYADPSGPDRDDAIETVAAERAAAAAERIEEVWRTSRATFEERTAGTSTQRRATPVDLEALRALGYVE